MRYRQFAATAALMLATAMVWGGAVAAQTAPGAEPTKKNPLRFTAINVSLQAGAAGVTQIVIERWSTEAERQVLLDLVAGAKVGAQGQRKLLDALQDVKPRVGYIRTPNSIGWDLRYARERNLADGTRQIVIATDKPVRGMAVASGSRVMDYPFTLIEMRMKPNAKGEGRMLVATSISTKDNHLELENYGQEPVRLTEITQETKK